MTIARVHMYKGNGDPPILPLIAHCVLVLYERFMRVSTFASGAVIHARVAVRNILVWPRGGRMLTHRLFVEIGAADLRFHLRQPGAIGGSVQVLSHGQ